MRATIDLDYDLDQGICIMLVPSKPISFDRTNSKCQMVGAEWAEQGSAYRVQQGSLEQRKVSQASREHFGKGLVDSHLEF